MTPFTVLVLLSVTACQAPEEEPSVRIGVEGRLIRVIPGPLLRPRRHFEDGAPISVRIAEATTDDSGTKYDLRFTGAKQGRYDLSQLLARADGSPVETLPKIFVSVVHTRPGDVPAELEWQLPPSPSLSPTVWWPYWGWYVVAVWLAGLLVLSLISLRRRLPHQQPPPLPSTARVRHGELLARAREGTLSASEKGELGRSLLAAWCAQRGLERFEPADALHRLRQDSEASRRCGLLEAWLYAPMTTSSLAPLEILEPLPSQTASPPS